MLEHETILGIWIQKAFIIRGVNDRKKLNLKVKMLYVTQDELKIRAQKKPSFTSFLF